MPPDLAKKNRVNKESKNRMIDRIAPMIDVVSAVDTVRCKIEKAYD